jgi:hypothetical protein
MASTNKRAAARWPAGVVSLHLMRSTRVEAQRIARQKLQAKQYAIQSEIDILLGRLMRLQRDLEQCFFVALPSTNTSQWGGL